MDALGLLLERHLPAAIRRGRYMIQDDAEEAVQEAAAAVVRQLESLRGPFRPWFLRIVHNQAVAIVKRRRPFVPLPDADGSEPRLAYEDEGFWFADRRDAVAILMNELSELQRQVFFLRATEDLSYKQIAHRLRSTEGSVRDAYYNASRKIAARRIDEGW